MLMVLEELGSATVDQIVEALGIDAVLAGFLIIEALDQGLVCVTTDRREAFERARS